jgi:hypothetical protein
MENCIISLKSSETLLFQKGDISNNNLFTLYDPNYLPNNLLKFGDRALDCPVFSYLPS